MEVVWRPSGWLPDDSVVPGAADPSVCGSVVAEVGSVGAKCSEVGETVEAGGVPVGCVHVGQGDGARFVFGAGVAGVADDDLEADVGAGGDREVAWGVPWCVEDRDPVGDGFAVGGEAEPVGFDVGPFGDGVKLGLRRGGRRRLVRG